MNKFKQHSQYTFLPLPPALLTYLPHTYVRLIVHTYIHTYIHTTIHTYNIQTYIQTEINGYAGTWIHRYMKCSHADMLTVILYACMYLRIYVPMYLCTCMQACIHRSVYILYTYIYVCTYMHALILFVYTCIPVHNTHDQQSRLCVCTYMCMRTDVHLVLLFAV